MIIATINMAMNTLATPYTRAGSLFCCVTGLSRRAYRWLGYIAIMSTFYTLSRLPTAVRLSYDVLSTAVDDTNMRLPSVVTTLRDIIDTDKLITVGTRRHSHRRRTHVYRKMVIRARLVVVTATAADCSRYTCWRLVETFVTSRMSGYGSAVVGSI